MTWGINVGLLSGHRGLIVGIANARSLAHGIARHARTEGAELAITYQNELMQRRVAPLAEELDAAIVSECDLTRDDQVAAVAATIAERWGSLDFVVHAVAGAKQEELAGRFLETSRDGFALAMDVSVYSLVTLVRACEPLLKKSEHSPSVLTLSYYGAEKAMPSYNVMGVAKAALEAAVRYLAVDLGPDCIRVNAISAGPVKTLSAAGVRGLRTMLTHMTEAAPLRRNVTLDDVGRAALFALSPLGSGMTGEIIHVDAGYNVVGATPRLASKADDGV